MGRMQLFAQIGLTETAVSRRHRLVWSLTSFFGDPRCCLQRLWLESGPNQLRARRHVRRKMTRILKIVVFSQLEHFAKLLNPIRLSKFQMPHGLFFDAIHKNAVQIGFRQISFFAIFSTDRWILASKRKPSHIPL